MSFIIPDLAERITWYQERLRPEDAAFGNGIADWTISSEYQDEPVSSNNGEPIWGCMCSPSRLPELVKLQPEDIAAKRAHIIVRTPKAQADLVEVERTLLHELGHVLVAPMQSDNREAEENAMHSLDHFFSKTKLSPEQGAILARSFHDPMARAYRAKDKAMPDPTQDENKDKPDKQPPAMQEGAPRTVEEIQAEMAMVDPTDATKLGALAVELRNALIKKGIDAQAGGNGPASTPEPPMVPPTMGMKPEDAYANARTELAKERKEAIEAIIDANPHLDDKQKAMTRKQGTVAAARELVATYPRVANQNEPARMGMQGNLKKDPKASGNPMARAMALAAENPMLRKLSGIGTLDNDGLHYEPQAGVLFYVDGTEQLNNQRAKLDARRAERRGAA